MGLLSVNVRAKEWRGIVPTRSTRADVIRKLGSPSQKLESRFNYHLESYEVDIVFSSSALCEGPKIPSERVLLIQLTLHPRVPLTNLGLDQSRFRSFSRSTTDRDFVGYIDDNDGLIVGTHKGQVDRMFYIASAAERSWCTSYYNNPERLASVYVDYTPLAFDIFSGLSLLDESARLDNFALHLRNQRELKAYVVLYPAFKTHNNEAQKTANRIKEYLTTKRGLESERIAVIIGAKREREETELWALPAGSPPPVGPR